MKACPIKEISKCAADAGIPFLVIGGYAVLAYGYTRMTDDLDLIVQRGRRERWGKLFEEFGMTVKNDAVTFLQLDSKDDKTMGVDLMFVSEAAFDLMSRTAMELTVAGVSARWYRCCI